MKVNVKRIKDMLPKKYATLVMNNKKTISGMLVAVLVLFGLSTKHTTNAGSTEKGIFGGALTGAAIGGIAGGGKGAGIGALTGAAVGGLIGSSKSNSSRDPREKQLDKLYKRNDKLEKKINNPKTSDSTRVKLQREMRDNNQQIDSIQGRNSRMQRPGGYANRF